MYGLQIVMQALRRGQSNIVLTRKPSLIELPPLILPRLTPILDLASKLDQFIVEKPNEILSFNHAVLHGSSSDFAGFLGQDRIWGKPNVACCAIEHLIMGEHGRKFAKNYDMYIAISQWNADFLNSLNLGPVHLCFQGIDSTLFYPGVRSQFYRDRFVIFSGGKFEFRKGQDIVVAAFKRFYERHPESLLICCWQNLLSPTPEPFLKIGHVTSVPRSAPQYGLEITPWLLEQGLPNTSFIDLPFTHNILMPSVLRECDVAIFPNRCEGGTNLVAMEAAACGVPTYVANNTGQKDLVNLMGFKGFFEQNVVTQSSTMSSFEGWGESSVDEVVATLENVYSQRNNALNYGQKLAETMMDWQWGALNDKLLDCVGVPRKGSA